MQSCTDVALQLASFCAGSTFTASLYPAPMRPANMSCDQGNLSKQFVHVQVAVITALGPLFGLSRIQAARSGLLLAAGGEFAFVAL